MKTKFLVAIYAAIMCIATPYILHKNAELSTESFIAGIVFELVCLILFIANAKYVFLRKRYLIPLR